MSKTLTLNFVRMIHSEAALALGMWATFDSVRYQIIGGAVWRMVYQEYYKEGGEEGYEQSYWHYTEWTMRDTNGKILYLTEDAEGFALSRAYKPPYQALPKEGDVFTNFERKSADYRIIEYGTATLQNFEGETGFDEAEKAEKYFFKYKKDGNTFSVEIPIDKDGKKDTEAREYYKDLPLSFDEVATAFAGNPNIQKLQNKSGNIKFAASASWLLTWFLLACLVYAFFPQKKIFSHKFELTAAQDRADSVVVFSTPSWEIAKADEMYLIEIDAKLGTMPTGVNPADMFVQVDVIDEELGIVNQVLGDFWEEYGRDSDGAWRESNRNSSAYLRSEKKGKYSANITVERTPLMLNWTAQMELNVYKYNMLWWHILIYFILSLTLALILSSYASKYKK